MINSAVIYLGDVRNRLSELADGSVQTCVTSPPYWGLRDYGNGDQIGLEQNPDQYVKQMVEVFREVKRVLSDDGTLWLNLGDSYSGSGKGPAGNLGAKNNERHLEHKHSAIVPEGLKPKDLVGIPWRVAFALQADGWFLRQDIIWAKPNPMPESVTDRCTKSHEYIFLLTKSAKYYYDNEAIKEPAVDGYKSNEFIPKSDKDLMDTTNIKSAATGASSNNRNDELIMTRNKRDVWTINTKPFKGAHFAVMPEALVEPCVLAGTSEAGACAMCRKPYVRIIEKGEIAERETRDHLVNVIPGRDKPSRMQSKHMLAIPKSTVGWSQACDCETSDVVPCTVLDPFTGSGTVAVVSLRLGRSFVGVELNPEYAEIAEKRITDSNPLFNQVEIVRE
jgi:DNA modification methylase